MTEGITMPPLCDDNTREPALFIVEQDGSICEADVMKNLKKLPGLQEIPADMEMVFLGNPKKQQQQPADGTEVIVSPENDGAESTSVISPVQYLIDVYRKSNLADKDRQTILTHDDQLVSLQLCMAQYNKQKFDDFDVDASEVLQLSYQLYQHKLNPSLTSPNSSATQSTFEAVLTLYREYCESCNAVDILDVYHKVKAWFANDQSQVDSRKNDLYVVLQWPRNALEIEIMKMLSIRGIYCHVKMDSSNDGIAVSSSVKSVEMLQPNTEIKQSTRTEAGAMPKSTSEVLARQLFVSYLALLVNTCDELSLARCLSRTTDDFNHDGFTALKNQARAKGMPMFQTAVSHVMRIRLGGKSYAPDPTSALAPHVKGLSDFVTVVQKLQTLVEEITETRTAVMKVLSSIRSALNACKVSTLRKSSIDTVTEELKQEAEVLMGVWKGSLVESPPKKVEGQGRIIYGLKTIRVVQAMLDREAGRTLTNKPVHVLTDNYTSQKTPMRIPSLLSQFRSPEVVDPESPEYQTLRSRLFASQQETTPVGPEKWKSDMAWAAPSADVGRSDNANDMDIFFSPVQKRSQSKKRNTLWATSPEGGRRKTNRLISPIDEVNETAVGTQDVSNRLTIRPQTILDCADTPKKGKTIRKVPQVSASEKENLQNEKSSGRVGQKRKPKRTLEKDDSCSSSQATKKAKKATKAPRKKKVVPLVKGQKTLNQFFRV